MGKNTLGKDTLKQKSKVIIVMGSDSDLPIMKDASIILKQLKISHELQVVSAHRTPLEMIEFAQKAEKNKIQVIIAGAGGAAHLPGMIASITNIPVIGVPVPLKNLQGMDSLLSIVQMPKGVPVATVAIGNSWNAGLLAAQILAFGGSEGDKSISQKLSEYKNTQRKNVLKKKLPKSF
jgi:phosphoribosylaminoimidazole carboxylase PurE protein